MANTLDNYYTELMKVPEPYGSPTDLSTFTHLVPVNTAIPEGTVVVVYEEEDGPAWSLPFHMATHEVREWEHGMFWTETPLV